MEKFGWFCLHILFFWIGTLYRGYVLSVGWNWFVSPTFGLTLLSPAVAYGISITAQMATWVPVGEWKKEDPEPSRLERLMRRVALSMVLPSVVLLMMWVVKTWWM